MDISISVTFPQVQEVLEAMAVNKAEILAKLDQLDSAIVIERSEFLEVLQMLREVKAQSEANADLTEISDKLNAIVDKTAGIVTKDEASTPPVVEPAPEPAPEPTPVPVDETPVDPIPAPVEEPPVVEPTPVPTEEPPAV